MVVEVYFDYTCGFSDRARHWLDGLDGLDGVQLEWRPFSLLEQKRGDEGPAMFERPETADDVSLVALAVHGAVRAAGGDVDGYRRRMFTDWHEQTGRLTPGDIVEFGRNAGMDNFDRDAAFAALGADHAAAVELGVFGTPTLVFGPQQVAFVKLDAVPAVERGRPLWDSVRQLAVGEPALREWQRVSPPEAAR